MSLSEIHRKYLNDHAVTDGTIERHLIRSEGEDIVFPWRDGEMATEQRRPWPGDSGTYYWEGGRDLHFWNLRDAGAVSPVLLVEGTKQSLAAASWAPDDFSVLGMAGCEGWSKCDLSRFEGRTVLVCLDADAGTNLSVYEAGDLFRQQTEFYDATVKYLWLPARGSQGLDDVLAKVPESKRAKFVTYLADKAQAKPAERRPATRKGARMESQLPDTGDRVGVAVNLDRKLVIDKITNEFKARWDGHTLFNYGEILTRVSGHETQPLDRDRFTAMLADTVACFRYTEATDKRPALFEPCWPDPPTIGAVMSKAEEFSPLSRVVRVPFLRPDGTVVTAPGYDRETQTVLVPSGLGVTEVADAPTSEQTRLAAKFLMDEWLGDLPFKTEADRSNALALVLTPFIRGIVPLVPLAVISGLQMGVGKNLFADCVSILTTGQAAMPLPYVGQEEEMRKQLTAAFASGAEMFVFDEAHVVEGAQLARAVTSLTYGDRVLGVSRIAKFPNQVTWVSLGNQVQVNGDMSRRVYFVYLHPSGRDVMDREAGSFRHPDLKLWTAENRDALVSAALTVLRGWWAAGRPSFSRGACMGSFEPWDRMMSGVLAYAGLPAFLTDMKERRSESDFTAAYWQAHVHWLHGLFGGEEFTTREVQEAALRDPRGYEAPPGLDDVTGKTFTRQLGQAYSKHRDRNYDGVRLVKSGMGHKSTIKWRTASDNGGREVEGGNAPTPHVWEKPVSGDVCVDTRVREEAGGVPSSSLLTSEPVALGFDIETASAAQLYTGGHDGPFVRLVGTTSEGTFPTSDAGLLIDGLKCADVIYGHNILGFDLQALAHHHGADYDALAAKAVDTLVLARLADPPGAKGASPDYGLDAVAQRLGHTGKSDDLKALAKEHGGYDQIPVNDARYVSYLRGDLAATRHVYEELTMSVPEALTDYVKREMRVAAIQNRMTLNGWGVNTELLAARVAAEDKVRELSTSTLRDRFGMPTEKVTYKLKFKRDWPEEYRTRVRPTFSWTFGVDDPLGEGPRSRWWVGSLPGYSAAIMRRYTSLFPEAAVARGLAARKVEPYDAPWATDAGREALERALRTAGATHLPTTAGGQLALSSDALGERRWYDAKQKRAFPGLLQKYGHLPEVREIAELITAATGATAKYAEIAKFVTPEGRVHGSIGDLQASGRWAMVRPSLTNLGKRGAKVEQRRVFDESKNGMVHIACDLSQVDMRALAGLSQDPAYMALFEPGRDAHMDMAEVYFGARTKANRERTKAINHGLNYGQGAAAVAERNGLDPSLVDAAVLARSEAYPRLMEWTEEVRQLGASGQLLDNGFGRLMRCDPERAWTQAPALMGQGAARDLMCQGLLRLVGRDSTVTKHLRGVVHDEVVLCVPMEEAEYWRGELAEAFTFEWRGVPILCEVSPPGASWTDCYANE